jgi:hypothetical protein
MEKSTPGEISRSRTKSMVERMEKAKRRVDPRNPNAVLETDNPKRPIFKLGLHNIDTS